MKKQELLTQEEFDAVTRLAGELLATKIVESEATKARIAIELKIAALIPGKEEGQRTINLANKGSVTVKRGLIYKADTQKIQDLGIWEEIGIASPIGMKSTRKLDVAAYKWYQENRPEEFKKIAEHVEVKPEKTSVTVKVASAK